VKIRLSALAWDSGVEDLATLCLPSLLQDGNLPWLLENGFEIALTIYTIEQDAARVVEVARAALAALPTATGRLDFTVGTMDVGERQPGRSVYERQWFLTECRAACEQQTGMMQLRSSAFYGNDSLQNLAVYCKKPGIAAFGPYLEVDSGFRGRLERYRATSGGRPLSNAQLTDMALAARNGSPMSCDVALDRNASFSSGTSYRALADDTTVMIQHVPALLLFWPEPSDIDSVRAYGRRMFPEKLMTEGRLRLLGSNEVAFFVDVVRDAAETAYPYVFEAGRRYNERFYYELPDTQLFENFLVSLRREPHVA
jgi:hypothetical protein